MEKMIINGNEFYEIDLECIKRKQQGKECVKSQEEERKQQGTYRKGNNNPGKKG
ncbi:MAG: hypothetical protein KH828_13395 [Clostridiales bacterium]|nr:hypothetical protein [Clostridiales bacterium]